MAHANYSTGATYIIKCRDREKVNGSTLYGRWGKWKPVRYGLRTEAAARLDVSERDTRAPLTEFAIFYRGKRLPRVTQ